MTSPMKMARHELLGEAIEPTFVLKPRQVDK